MPTLKQIEEADIRQLLGWIRGIDIKTTERVGELSLNRTLGRIVIIDPRHRHIFYRIIDYKEKLPDSINFGYFVIRWDLGNFLTWIDGESIKIKTYDEVISLRRL